MIFNLSRQLYKDFKLIKKISKIINCSIFSKVAFMTILILNLCVISYSLTAKTLRITR